MISGSRASNVTRAREVPVPRTFDVAVLVGSTRQGSLTRQLALAFGRLVPPSLKLDLVGLRDVAMYDPDLDVAPIPAAWVALRERVRRADAVLFVTPEYNRSVPAVLKNAVDVGSRPYTANAWGGKPCAIFGASPGAMGAFGAVQHLRQIVSCLDMPVMPTPEVYVGNVATLLDPAGELTNPKTAALLSKAGMAFATWVERNVGG